MEFGTGKGNQYPRQECRLQVSGNESQDRPQYHVGEKIKYAGKDMIVIGCFQDVCHNGWRYDLVPEEQIVHLVPEYKMSKMMDSQEHSQLEYIRDWCAREDCKIETSCGDYDTEDWRYSIIVTGNSRDIHIASSAKTLNKAYSRMVEVLERQK